MSSQLTIQSPRRSAELAHMRTSQLIMSDSHLASWVGLPLELTSVPFSALVFTLTLSGLSVYVSLLWCGLTRTKAPASRYLTDVLREVLALPGYHSWEPDPGLWLLRAICPVCPCQRPFCKPGTPTHCCVPQLLAKITGDFVKKKGKTKQ